MIQEIVAILDFDQCDDDFIFLVIEPKRFHEQAIRRWKDPRMLFMIKYSLFMEAFFKKLN